MARITRTKVSNTKTAGAKASKIRPKPTAKAPAARASRPRGTRWPKPVPPEAVLEIFQRFAAANPHPRGELLYKNPFTLLIAVVLSAQATDAGVNKATPALFALADTPEKMLALGEDKVRDLVKTIGLYRAKAKNIIGLSRALIERFGSEVPRTREELETLPGVGRKTANVVLNNAFDQPTIAVDTHVFRVSNRIPLAPGKTPEAVEEGLEKIIPDAYKQHAHHWLILHGRYICQARKPQCWRCLIEDLCRWPEKTPDPAP
ncbi:MAG: endonuclease III [Methylovirgula sp.]|uniref:endonuclease III n=1 Tax=Methylovirgula sp. TaxID=1978224 RepID=UPI0030761C45